MRVFLDLDGVLFDFNKSARAIMGMEPEEYEKLHGQIKFWEKIFSVHNFYQNLEPMTDARQLFDGVHELGFWPICLSGIPRSHPGESDPVPDQKRKCLTKHFGSNTNLITCFARQKSNYCEPGDVLIDDRSEFKFLWEKAGGKFIVHQNAKQSLKELKKYLKWKNVR